MAGYPDDTQFAGLIEAATAAADAHQRDLGKRKRDEEDAYNHISTDIAFGDAPPLKTPTLTNSAAVLFREPSEKSKKYSRPPLGKVFTSLELAPEAFLRLQNAAKAYMLSEEHPERKDVVGHKKTQNNNDQAKLKLYQCVEEFLQQDDTGEKFFGHAADVTAPDAPPRTFFWPEDRNRIVKALMPLLRKMVTNERQRIYAAETRKQDPKKSSARAGGDQMTASNGGTPQTIDESMAPEIDPSLQEQNGKPGHSEATALSASDHVPTQTHADQSTLTLRISIVTKDGEIRKRVMPEFSLASEDAGSFEQFLDGLKRNLDILHGKVEVKALVPQGGLVSLGNDGDWLMAQLAVSTEEWMNTQLQIVVEI